MLHHAAAVLCLALAVPGTLAAVEPREVLERFRREHAGVAYRFGACGRARMDCSCLIQRLFREHFDLALPRDTLDQTRSMRFLRVRTIRNPDQITPRNLCVGDLIYTYHGASWADGLRHVAVYAGDGQVLHASSYLGGVGMSPLSWVQQFPLYGVYRPLGC